MCALVCLCVRANGVARRLLMLDIAVTVTLSLSLLCAPVSPSRPFQHSHHTTAVIFNEITLAFQVETTQRNVPSCPVLSCPIFNSIINIKLVICFREFTFSLFINKLRVARGGGGGGDGGGGGGDSDAKRILLLRVVYKI